MASSVCWLVLSVDSLLNPRQTPSDRVKSGFGQCAWKHPSSADALTDATSSLSGKAHGTRVSLPRQEPWCRRHSSVCHQCGRDCFAPSLSSIFPPLSLLCHRYDEAPVTSTHGNGEKGTWERVGVVDHDPRSVGLPVSLRIEWTSQSRQVATLCVLLG